MAKKSMINRNNKRIELEKKYAQKRLELKNIIYSNKDNLEEVFKAQQAIALLPRSSSKTRTKNICFVTGRSRGNYRRFSLCRNQLRKMASFADIPGIKKSSW
jgi:small subunit ribosomal protein S14